jgi:hypothetical protein
MVGYVIDSLMFSNYKKRYIIIALHLAEKKKKHRMFHAHRLMLYCYRSHYIPKNIYIYIYRMGRF